MSSIHKLEESLNDLLVDVFNYILRFEEKSLKTFSDTPVTVAEAHILEAIGKNNENITVTEVATALGITAPTATVAVKKLESKGLLTKTSCNDDGRRFIIGLTPSGEKINRAHALFHRSMVRNMCRGLSDEEKDVLLSAVKKISEFFKEKVET